MLYTRSTPTRSPNHATETRSEIESPPVAGINCIRMVHKSTRGYHSRVTIYDLYERLGKGQAYKKLHNRL